MISYRNIPTRSEMQSDDSLDLIDESKLKIVFTHTEQDPTVSLLCNCYMVKNLKL